MEIEAIQKQRFAYLFRLYTKNNGDPRVWSYSIEIGNKLNFPKELTGLITRYLSDGHLIKLQTYKETFPKKDSLLSTIGLGIFGHVYDTFVVGEIGKSIWKRLSKEPLGPIPEYGKNSKALINHMSDFKNRNLYPLVSITYQGVIEVEQALRIPANPTLNFNAFIVQRIDK